MACVSDVSQKVEATATGAFEPDVRQTLPAPLDYTLIPALQAPRSWTATWSKTVMDRTESIPVVRHYCLHVRACHGRAVPCALDMSACDMSCCMRRLHIGFSGLVQAWNAGITKPRRAVLTVYSTARVRQNRTEAMRRKLNKRRRLDGHYLE